jgi:hypothetical protein
MLVFKLDCPDMGFAKGDLAEGISEVDMRQLRAGGVVGEVDDAEAAHAAADKAEKPAEPEKTKPASPAKTKAK